jgi:2-oxoglutarate dehydrogenase E2 component (dihydrolipoamide succinyltransferase)
MKDGEYMKVEVVMPKMGESLQEGTIIRWLKQLGEKVERDEMLLEISTDKVDTEVPSPVAGVLTEILAGENVTVEIGKVIAYIETDANAAVAPIAPITEAQPVPAASPAIEPDSAKPITTAAQTGALVDVVMPKMGESLQEGTIIRWLKQLGEKVERDEMLLEISTDKVDTEVPSPVAGVLTEILAGENVTVEIGKVIARISTGEMPVAHSVPTSEMKPAKVHEEPVAEIKIESGKNRFYSPLVKSIAQAEGISQAELDSIKGSGADGRVNKADILAYIEQRKTKPAATSASVAASQPAAVVQKSLSPVVAPPKQVVQTTPAYTTPAVHGAESEIIPMDRVRQLISEHMIYSKQTSAHVTSVAEADVTGIVRFREKFKTEFERREGFKLTFTPFFAKATIDGVKAFPMVNVSVDGKNIIKHLRINLSFATALDDGNLIVPVIKNADALNIAGLARSVYDLSTRARTKRLNPDDIQGGTITITNVGTFGTLFGTPVINQPQSAIIGIGAIEKRPVVRQLDGDDVIVIRSMAYVSITYDHRVIDGMLAGQCLAAIVRSLENMSEDTLSAAF